MTCSGRAKKIRAMLEAQRIPDREFNRLYKNTKSARKLVPTGPTDRPKTKRHTNEDFIDFKRRRKKVNNAKGERKRLWRIR